MQTLKSFQEIVGHFVNLKGQCRIADLGSGYNGAFGSFSLASENIQIDAVDVIFGGVFIPGESPQQQPTNELETSPFINLFGCRIEQFLQDKAAENASYDIILISNVYSARLDVLAIRCLLGEKGVFIAGKYNGHTDRSPNPVEQRKILLRTYPGFSMFWQLINGAFAMNQAGTLTSKYPNESLEFYFGDDVIPMK
jgi:hypothetical protein